MPTTANPGFLKSTIQVFTNYKGLGEKTFDQLTDAQLQWKPNASSNSIALIVHHLSGNMLSRWTDFLTSDGEKPWRDREAEFETGYADRASMMEAWDKGWECLLSALKGLGPEDLR